MEVNLVLFKKNGSRKTFSLPGGATVIGRRRHSDFYIPLLSVSRRHCQLNCDGGVLKIRDLGSRNGTYLNGKQIDEAVIKPGDSIEVGPLTFVFQIDGQPGEVVPPQRAKPKAPRQETPASKAATEEDSGSFLELDESDSFLADLEDL